MDVDAVLLATADGLQGVADGCTNSEFAIQMAKRAQAVRDVHGAVAKLLEANRRTIEAFEELGRASGVASNHFARRECEAAMVAQKAALTCFGTAK